MCLNNISVYAIWRVLSAAGSPAAVRGPQWDSQMGSVSDKPEGLTLAPKTLQASEQKGHAAEQWLAQKQVVQP